MEEHKPSCVYHGSQDLVAKLDPRPGRCRLVARNREYAIYASHYRNYAIPFAFTLIADERGNRRWTHSWDCSGCEPRIIIQAGYLDVSRVGYLYRLPSDTFRRIDDFQWISRAPVIPLDYEVVRPQDYLHWVEHAERVRGMTGPAGNGL